MTVRVETRVVSVRGSRRVLLQLPHGYVVLTSLAARELAELLVDMAKAVDDEPPLAYLPPRDRAD